MEDGQRRRLFYCARGQNCTRKARENGIRVKQDTEVRAEDNGSASEADFQKARAELSDRINARYGARHVTAQRPRLAPAK